MSVKWIIVGLIIVAGVGALVVYLRAPIGLFIAIKLENQTANHLAQGDYDAAERVATRALTIGKWAAGTNDPDVALIRLNLAGLYRYQGRHEEAQVLMERSLEATEQAAGREHLVALFLDHLGDLHRDQGRYAEAEPLYQRSLAIWEKALGPEHPDVARTLENYAALLRLTARADEAERMEARAKAIRAKYE